MASRGYDRLARYSFPLVLRRLTARTLRRAAYRRELPALFAQPAHAHLRIARLRRPREAAAWLAGLAPE